MDDQTCCFQNRWKNSRSAFEVLQLNLAGDFYRTLQLLVLVDSLIRLVDVGTLYFGQFNVKKRPKMPREISKHARPSCGMDIGAFVMPHGHMMSMNINDGGAACATFTILMRIGYYHSTEFQHLSADCQHVSI